ncbi:hypothetical protein CRV24_009578 [Beauveria bassiana]|nr:hypothetical protein CRV24_009578 [Beauveria bassiana]
MKLVAVIFAVVTVASSMPMEQQKCGGFCTAEYDPIKCTNGIVYGNACELACNPRAFDGVTCSSGAQE